MRKITHRTPRRRLRRFLLVKMNEGAGQPLWGIYDALKREWTLHETKEMALQATKGMRRKP